MIFLDWPNDTKRESKMPLFSPTNQTQLPISEKKCFLLDSTPLPFNLHFYNIMQKINRRDIMPTSPSYSQIEIANYLGLSKSAISMVIKNH